MHVVGAVSQNENAPVFAGVVRYNFDTKQM